MYIIFEEISVNVKEQLIFALKQSDMGRGFCATTPRFYQNQEYLTNNGDYEQKP